MHVPTSMAAGTRRAPCRPPRGLARPGPGACAHGRAGSPDRKGSPQGPQCPCAMGRRRAWPWPARAWRRRRKSWGAHPALRHISQTRGPERMENGIGARRPPCPKRRLHRGRCAGQAPHAPGRPPVADSDPASHGAGLQGAAPTAGPLPALPHVHRAPPPGGHAAPARARRQGTLRGFFSGPASRHFY